MLIFRCDALLLQQLTRSPLKLPAEYYGPPMFHRSTVELTMLHAGLLYHTTLRIEISCVLLQQTFHKITHYMSRG